MLQKQVFYAGLVYEAAQFLPQFRAQVKRFVGMAHVICREDRSILLFMPESVNRIHQRCFVGWIETEKNADQTGEAEGHHNGNH
jgi:hypothetical protein